MHFSTVALVSFLAAVHALPADSSDSNLNVICSVKSTDEINETNGDSPLISDCEIMRDNISGGGSWVVFEDGDHHQLIQLNTCAFGVESVSIDAFRFKIGNGDITNMITNSIRNYGRDGRVGASGQITCGYTGAEGTTDLRWNVLQNENQ